MRSLFLSAIFLAPTLALADSETLAAIDKARVLRLATDEATAAKQMWAWSEAIARAEKGRQSAEAREVLDIEKALYAMVFKSYETIKVCTQPSKEACAAALELAAAEEDAFSAKYKPKPVWRFYGDTVYQVLLGTRGQRDFLRRDQDRVIAAAAWKDAAAVAAKAIEARAAAFAAVSPDADEATLKAALSAAEAANAACDSMSTLRRFEGMEYPAGCPRARSGTANSPDSTQLALLRNRLPASAEFSNASLCKQPCGNPTLCPPACPGPLGEAAVFPNVDFNAIDAHAQVRTLFETVHPSRYRFLTRDVMEGGEVLAKRGEVVLITTLEPATRGSVLVLTLGNRGLTVAPTFLTATRIKGARLHHLKATDCPVVAPNAAGKPALLGTSWDSVVDDAPPDGEPAFLQLLDPNDAAYSAFVRQSDSFLGCFDKTMKRLDPDGTAWQYVRETYVVRTGQTLKVEKLDEGFRRQACASCGCRKYNAARAALAAKVLGPYQKQELEAYAATATLIEKRLGR